MGAAHKTQALRHCGRRGEPELADVEVADPEDTEVLVRVEAAGICHSDLHVLDAGPGVLPYRFPFTLGHEIAGHIAAAGPQAEGIAIGERVAIYAPWGCGRCRRCVAGQDNYCDQRADLGWSGAGLGLDGGMAGYVLVPHPRYLVPIGDLDAVQAAPLTDAGLTSYHAIAARAAKLTKGTTAGVIGVGGLGHLAIQILRALTASQVIAVDLRDDALQLAHASGAHHTILSGSDTNAALRSATRGAGLDAVFDFVGNDTTLSLGARSLRSGGDLVVVGSGAGTLTVTKPGALPPGASVSLPFWGTRAELHEVITLARRGRLTVSTEVSPLVEAPRALDRLRRGEILGRAVVVPP